MDLLKSSGLNEELKKDYEVLKKAKSSNDNTIGRTLDIVVRDLKRKKNNPSVIEDPEERGRLYWRYFFDKF